VLVTISPNYLTLTPNSSNSASSSRGVPGCDNGGGRSKQQEESNNLDINRSVRAAGAFFARIARYDL